MSRFAHLTRLNDAAFLTHGLTGARVAMAADLAAAVAELRDQPFTEEEFGERAHGGTLLLNALRSRQLIVEAGCDELAEAERYAGLADTSHASSGSGAPPDRAAFWGGHRYGAEPGRTAGRPLRVVAVGGCVLDFARDELLTAGDRRGWEVELSTHWPESPRGLTALLPPGRVDLAILHLPIYPNLTRVLDAGALAKGEERRSGVAYLKRLYTQWVRSFAAALPDGCVGVVHNVAPTALSPFGRYEHRVDYNTRAVLADLNGHVDELVRDHPGLMLLDEERLAVRHGALALFDDHLLPFGHHGGNLDPRVDVPHQLPLYSRVLATEYLDLYDSATRQGEIKCIVTDLDGTLWPGIAADDGFGWTDMDRTSTWMALGLHQALLLLKSRGLLLATCSKGTAEHTLRVWESSSHPLTARPEDFVLHRINWRRKPDNLQDIAETLRFPLSALVFLDDNPVERLEVARALPEVRVIDAAPYEFRRILLSMPELDRPVAGVEAASRTETTRSMLARGDLAGRLDPADLITELLVEVEMAQAGPDHLARITELFQRTNQYTTTAWRPSLAEMRRYLQAPGRGVQVCRVRDRFADYGIVGAVAFDGETVDCLAVSCRVVGLQIGPVLLAAAIERAGLADRRPTGRIVPTGRNEPALNLYAEAGFTDLGDGAFRLESADDLRTSDQWPHHVKHC
ncbi:HAD-IIIC family phosphatase [Nonomuraea sp. NPDC005650]|uniref:HAD-IIIC family phosphatase n=1 Tax=Nonomuraea sp. NPDC005650 TaxID=3157045 RepID=UPI00339E0364